MKFFQKKEVTLEKTPILFRLERRHTLLDGAKDEVADGEPKRAYRANSVGSYTRSPTADVLSPKQSMSNGNRSNYSAASTVIITESELSSSWLYNTRKAKIDSDEETMSTNSKASTDVQDLQPVQLQDPDLMPVPVPLKKRPEKVSSCCCYLLVVLTICLASLGIMAAIGGIIYMEIFVGYRKVAHGKDAYPDPSLKATINFENKNNQSPLHPNEGWSLSGFRNLADDSPAARDFVDNIKSHGITIQSEPQKTSIDEIGGNVSDDNLNEDSKMHSNHEDKLNGNGIDKDSLHRDNDVIEDIMLGGGNNGDYDKVDNSDFIDSNSEATVQKGTNDPISSIVVSQDNSENEDNFDLENEHDEINTDSFDISHFAGLESILNDQKKSRFPRMEQDTVNNSIEVDEEHILDIKNPDTSVNDYQEYENGFEIQPQNRNLFDDNSLDYDVVMNRPIVEAKPPIDFQRHFINNQNKDFSEPLTIQDMDRKFTLSEILRHLRTLEVNNQLPSTRQSQKSVTETITSSVTDNQDFGSEKSEYLKNLRRKIYV